jgi:serine/threonine protein phosphatase 1
MTDTLPHPRRSPRKGLKELLFGTKREAPAVPPGQRVYIVGDIHGCAALLDRLLEMVVADASNGPATRLLIYVGDYVDRGPDSRGVVETVLNSPQGFETRALRGNHEQALLDFLVDPLTYRIWKNYGAQETLLSYGVRPPLFDDVKAITDARDAFASKLPERHRGFFEELALSTEVGDYFVAHAGARPGVALGAQSAEDLLWIREDFLFSGSDFGKVVVHGHTPTEAVVRRKNRIGIDTGAYATGRLTALVLEGESVKLLQT